MVLEAEINYEETESSQSIMDISKSPSRYTIHPFQKYPIPFPTQQNPNYKNKFKYKVTLNTKKMSTTNTTVQLAIPAIVNLSQFTNVQRGTIFMWFVTVLVILIVTGIRLISGNLDPDGVSYEEGREGAPGKEGDKKEANMESSEAFDKAVIKSQVLTEDDTGTVRLMKKVTKFSTVLVPLTITFALGFSLGVTYAFSFVLYFLILIPLILFNLLEFHKWVFEHRAFICIFDNIWIIATFFWLLNIWTTGKFLQPYYMVQWTTTA